MNTKLIFIFAASISLATVVMPYFANFTSLALLSCTVYYPFPLFKCISTILLRTKFFLREGKSLQEVVPIFNLLSRFIYIFYIIKMVYFQMRFISGFHNVLPFNCKSSTFRYRVTAFYRISWLRCINRKVFFNMFSHFT